MTLHPPLRKRSQQNYPIDDVVKGEAFRGLSAEETFTQIYAKGAWGGGSGTGSLPAHCVRWVSCVRTFIRDERVRSVVDLGCGDWQFSPYIYKDLTVDYTGYDVVLPVIEENRSRWSGKGFRFEHLDFSDRLCEVVDAELYILKDVLQHWSSGRIRNFLHTLLSTKVKLRHVLICNCAKPTDWPETDIIDGGWRPLQAARPPLDEFMPKVVLRFPSLPNEKEVCVLRKGSLPTHCSRASQSLTCVARVFASVSCVGGRHTFSVASSCSFNHGRWCQRRPKDIQRLSRLLVE
eukprot:TRINITY_DN57950_c0_g1_i1.p1 TRINITY_DN57950_c0_g1~~TRINITY_DN57950_c0_g1_i1.p1  ORF type:complete len:291 (+),score=39.68 TRINITY_DN57950_c0_g1_i1:73-945(+)